MGQGEPLVPFWGALLAVLWSGSWPPRETTALALFSQITMRRGLSSCCIPDGILTT